MQSATAETISCPSCGKKYACKPEFAGKQVRCKCGTVIIVPLASSLPPPPMPGLAPAHDQPPSMAPLIPLIRPAAEMDSEDLYDLAEDKTAAPPRPTAATKTNNRVAMPIVVPGLDDDAECPGCENPMQPGTIICTRCGFNLKTGERPQKPAAAVASAAAVFAKLNKPTKVPVHEDRKTEIAKLLLPLAALIAVLSLGIGGYTMMLKLHKPAAPMKGADAQVAEFLADPGGKEIHAWFKQDPMRMAGEYSESQAIARADDLQQLGAKQVIAFGGRMTLSLAVELPDDPDKRKALFAWESKFAINHNYKPDTDVGQHYLLLKLNP